MCTTTQYKLQGPPGAYPGRKEGLRMSEKNLAYVSIHVRLLDEQYEWLRKYCYENRISQAEVVREALQIYRQKKDKSY
jgi:hypothetical protein